MGRKKITQVLNLKLPLREDFGYVYSLKELTIRKQTGTLLCI